jgi:hypothetical protein
MTVATANLKQIQEGGLQEIKVYTPICVAQTSEIRKYEQQGDRPDTDYG